MCNVKYERVWRIILRVYTRAQRTESQYLLLTLGFLVGDRWRARMYIRYAYEYEKGTTQSEYYPEEDGLHTRTQCIRNTNGEAYA